LWQRQYTWRAADHRLLWRDILEQYAQASGRRRRNRTGALPRQHRLVASSGRREVASYLIVDGQHTE
jgi:hypothetical protein